MVDGLWLDDFLNNFRGGARPNQFFCDLVVPSALKGSVPDSTQAENRFRFYATGTDIPSSQIGQVVLPTRGGRQMKVAGDRTFEDWTITVRNDVDFPVRNMFESWMDLIDGNVQGGHSNAVQIPLDYMSSGDVFQLDKSTESKIEKTYKFIGIWPSNLGNISLSWDSNDTVEEFPVTLTVQSWESDTTRNNTGAESFATTSGAL